MKKKIPDSFVPDRPLKEYPTEIGSQKFSPDNIELFKLEKTSKIKKYYNQKFEEISQQYQKLIKDIQVNEMIYTSKYNFEPVVGSSYYLYDKGDNRFLSMISPEDWNGKFTCIGKFQLLSDGRWIECE